MFAGERKEAMDTFDAIQQRRAVKHYDPDHRLTAQEEEKLFEHAILSPTSYNIQNWRFVVVKDADQRKAMRAAAWDQAQVTEASLLIVLSADLKAYEKDTERYWRDAPAEVSEMLVGMTKSFYDGKDRLQRDEAMRSVGIAAQTIMLSAKAMGYDSCPMIGFDPDAVGEVINLPQDHVVGMLVVVGKKLKDAQPRGGQLALDDVFVTDSF
jgi:nitroreductase